MISLGGCCFEEGASLPSSPPFLAFLAPLPPQPPPTGGASSSVSSTALFFLSEADDAVLLFFLEESPSCSSSPISPPVVLPPSRLTPPFLFGRGWKATAANVLLKTFEAS